MLKDGLVIGYIENPDIEVQLCAVNQNPFAIEFINNPHISALILAVRKNKHTRKFIKEIDLIRLDNINNMKVPCIY